MDSWDSWNIDRDGVIRNAQSWNYTNRYYVGSEDLDVYGHWVNVPDYGRVWSPTGVGTGLLTARVAGSGSRTGAGRGFRVNPGAGRPITTAAGFSMENPGCGGRGRLTARETTPGVGSGLRVVLRIRRPPWSFRRVRVGGLAATWPGDSFYPWYGQNGSQLKGVSVTDAINITRLTRVVAHCAMTTSSPM